MNYKYVSIGDKRWYAEQAIEKANKKKTSINPLVVEGKIVKNYWGKAWVEHFKNYSDFYNRLSRGSSYIKNGLVIDLKINDQMIYGQVIGSRKTPYKIEVAIEKIIPTKLERLINLCKDNINNLNDLVTGKFPKSLAEEFLSEENGLFPKPKEIKFHCNCPDYAYLCKHVAAVLYGVGAMFDKDPLLFFKLRGINTDDLIKKTAEEKVKTIVRKTKKSSSKNLTENEVDELFSDILD